MSFPSPPLRTAITTNPFYSLDILASMLRISDIAVLVAAAYAMHWIRFQSFALPHLFILCIICAVLLLMVLAPIFYLYEPRNIGRFLPQLMPLTMTLGLTLLCLLAGLFFVHSGATFSRIWIAGWFILSALGMIYSRLKLSGHIGRLVKNGILQRNIVLICSEGSHVSLSNELLKNSNSLSIVGIFFMPEHNLDEITHQAMPSESIIIPSFAALLDYCHTHMIDDVMMAPELEHHPLRDALFKGLEVLPCNINYCLPSFFQHRSARYVELISQVPVVTLLKAPLRGKNFFLKRLKDILISTIILILLSPVLLGVALWIACQKDGPILFRQIRHGFAGKPFTIYKFRSMKTHQTAEGTIVQATENDARLTPIGRFIRRTSIDELPQLFNVLKGEMSVVGPRPHAIEHNDYYQELINGYATRHRIKPGITGWAQVNGLRGETDTLEKMHQRVQYDLDYIENWTIGFDLKILWLTTLTLLTRENAY